MQNTKRILTIEDEAALRNALVEKLSHEGYEVLSAKNGEEGLEIALREHPDLILLDIVMPKMDGMEVLESLRADAWGQNVEIIVLTNLNDNERVAEAIKRHAFDYFVKSDIKLQEVVQKVKEKLTN